MPSRASRVTQGWWAPPAPCQPGSTRMLSVSSLSVCFATSERSPRDAAPAARPRRVPAQLSPCLLQVHPASLPQAASRHSSPPLCCRFTHPLMLGSGMHTTGIPHPAIVPHSGKQEMEHYDRNM